MAGAGLTAALILGAPAVASAGESPQGGVGAGTASCPRVEHGQAVIDFLIAHPDVAALLQSLRDLPPEDRAASWAEYLSAHPDVADAVAELRAEFHDGGWEHVRWHAARSAVVRRVIDALAAHPELADLLAVLRDTPVGERRGLVQDYLTNHPHVRAELRDLAGALRTPGAACRPGG